MKKLICLLFAIVCSTSGCFLFKPPVISGSALPSEEEQWAKTMEKWYSRWEKPTYFIPNGQQNSMNFSNDDRVAPVRPLDEIDNEINFISEGSSKINGKTHVVGKGDTLSSIAVQYYGKSSFWKKIYQANKNRIKNKNQLLIGQELLIP